jgi:V8-like Glu-specific endopeptidase
VEQIFVASGFAQGSSTDYALIRLREPLGQGLGFWGSTAATAITNGTSINNNSPITVCGYPADKPYDPAMKCWNRSVNTFRRCYHTSPYNSTHGRNRLCGTFQFASYDGIVESVQAGKIIHYTSDTCPAHSGSPVWLYFPHNKSRVLIGVHITGDDGVGAVANRAVLIDSSVRSFIRQYSV